MTRSDGQLSRDFLGGDRFLSTTEIARLFRVDYKTVSRWCRLGRVPNTPDGKPGVLQMGRGHYRIRESVVHGLLDGTLKLEGVNDGDEQ